MPEPVSLVRRRSGTAAASVVVGVLVVAAGSVAGPAPASAHERRSAAGVQLVVGWGDEPAYTGVLNSVQVTVTADGAPVTDLGDGLRVEVVKGDDRVTLPLVSSPRPGAAAPPGEYRAWLVPTRSGAYSFRLFGTARGQRVDETFTASPTTFHEVEDSAALQFPAKDPSTGQIATRIDREFPRLDARTGDLERRLGEAESRADRAQILALAGLGAGLAGLAVAVAARRRRPGGGGAAGDVPASGGRAREAPVSGRPPRA